MKRHVLTRREMVENCVSRGLLVGGVSMSAPKLLALWQDGSAAARKPTPIEVLGPFFKKNAPSTTNLRAPGDPGFPLRVVGKVYSASGEVLPSAQVEMWQADHNGRYDVVGYKYRTKFTVDATAEYVVETVMPGHYSDRPAQHIHYLITAPGHKALITQVYFATDPWFEGDPDKNFTKRSIVGNRDLVRPVKLFEGPGQPRAEVSFDIVMEKA
jgi:protocatechuate 3,4-dioxygenase beta subunit